MEDEIYIKKGDYRKCHKCHTIRNMNLLETPEIYPSIFCAKARNNKDKIVAYRKPKK